MQPQLMYMDNKTITILFAEVSDQYGTSRPVGVYSTPEKAAQAAQLIRKSRTFTCEMLMDVPPLEVV